MLPWEIEHVLRCENGFEVHVCNVSEEGLPLRVSLIEFPHKKTSKHHFASLS
jgi:hypothetical protein